VNCNIVSLEFIFEAASTVKTGKKKKELHYNMLASQHQHRRSIDNNK